MNNNEQMSIFSQPSDQDILKFLEQKFNWLEPVDDLNTTILEPIILSEIKNLYAATDRYDIRFSYEELGAGLNFDESIYPRTKGLVTSTQVYKISNFISGITHYYSSEGMYLATKLNN